MRPAHTTDFPGSLEQKRRRAFYLEWVTLGALAVIAIVMYLSMGSSQAMKAAWLEDLISMGPPIAFLFAYMVEYRKPTERFPYGYERAGTLAFLAAGFFLLILGGYMVYESLHQLLTRSHPSIGLYEVFGHPVWHGWVMLAALTFSMIPPLILGRMKRRLAEDLNDETLYTDAKMNEDDWLTAAAASLGVIGIALGFWWADALAAALISINVVYDGIVNLRRAMADLCDHRPNKVGGMEPLELDHVVQDRLLELDWVTAADARFRIVGRRAAGTAFVSTRDGTINADQTREAERLLRAFNDSISQVTISLRQALD